jgi:hypothetical protein
VRGTLLAIGFVILPTKHETLEVAGPGPKRQALLEEEDGRATMLKWRQGGVGWLQRMRMLRGRSPGVRKYAGTVGLLLWAPEGARIAGVGNP